MIYHIAQSTHDILTEIGTYTDDSISGILHKALKQYNENNHPNYKDKKKFKTNLASRFIQHQGSKLGTGQRYSVAQTANFLNTSESSVYGWLHGKQIPDFYKKIMNGVINGAE